jgi:nucleoside-diphosphate-sugar epimerase
VLLSHSFFVELTRDFISPGDRQAFPGFLNAYKRQQTHVQIGNNTNLFDWTYVDNLVHAHLLAADQLTSGSGVAGEIFFITNGDPIPFWDFPRMIWSRLAAAGVKPVPPVRKPFVMPKFVGMIVGFIMEYIAYFTGKQATFTRFSVTFCCATRWHNISKARRILGYRPLINNEDGVERMVNVCIFASRVFPINSDISPVVACRTSKSELSSYQPSISSRPIHSRLCFAAPWPLFPLQCFWREIFWM